MKNRGFTLIELLVVIILIAAIVLLVLPNITNSVNNYNINVDKTTLNIIKHATNLYISDNSNSFMKRSENTYCISLNELIKEKYLKNTIEYNDQDITNIKVVKVTYDNGFNYELVNKNSCERIIKFDTICEADKEQLYASNEHDIGYKYNCKVDPDKEPYKFYVLSYNDEDGNITFDKETAKSVNLIMDRNICSDGTPTEEGKTCFVAWVSTEKYYEDVGGVIPDEILFDQGICQYDGYCGLNDKGPVTAMEYLNNATKTWTNTNEISIESLTECNFNVNECEEKIMEKKYNMYARMPYYSEVSDYDIINAISAKGGYWLLSSYIEYSDRVWAIYSGSLDWYYPSIDNTIGVRPIINLKL